jgi:hypothetical protein
VAERMTAETSAGERPASLPQGIRVSWWRRRKKLLIAGGTVLVLLIAGLGWFSYCHTARYVDFGGASCVLRVTVKDERGQPVEGAALALRTRSGRGKGSLVDDDQGCASWTSGPDGQIVCRLISRGDWGGTSRALFWLIPIEDYSKPDYRGEVSCPGYRQASFRLNAASDPAQGTMTDSSNPAMGAIEVRLYDRTVALDRR